MSLCVYGPYVYPLSVCLGVYFALFTCPLRMPCVYVSSPLRKSPVCISFEYMPPVCALVRVYAPYVCPLCVVCMSPYILCSLCRPHMYVPCVYVSGTSLSVYAPCVFPVCMSSVYMSLVHRSVCMSPLCMSLCLRRSMCMPTVHAPCICTLCVCTLCVCSCM